MKIGDRVRLTRVPPPTEAARYDHDDMHTRTVFQQCVGHVFRIRGIGTNSPHGETDDLELWVHRGADCGNVVKADTIWVEPDYVQAVPARAIVSWRSSKWITGVLTGSVLVLVVGFIIWQRAAAQGTRTHEERTA